MQLLQSTLLLLLSSAAATVSASPVASSPSPASGAGAETLTVRDDMTCYSGGKKWGDNRGSAIASLGKWCNGDSRTDGSGGFGAGQIKYGCYNLPFGKNKVEFWVQNERNGGGHLSEGACNAYVKRAINDCGRGGWGRADSWYFRADVNSGNC